MLRPFVARHQVGRYWRDSGHKSTCRLGHSIENDPIADISRIEIPQRSADHRVLCRQAAARRIAFSSELRGSCDEAVRPDEREGSWTRQAKKKEDQGLIVLATRKPRVSNQTIIWRFLRTAARTSSALVAPGTAADDTVAWIAAPEPR